jgi:hypothetical protein
LQTNVPRKEKIPLMGTNVRAMISLEIEHMFAIMGSREAKSVR